MLLEPVMTPMLAGMVWQNTNKLAGLVEGDGAGRVRFWACMHIFMREGLVSGDPDVGTHHRDESWDGMADEMRKLQTLGPNWRLGQMVKDLHAAAPGTKAGAEADQLMILEGLEEEVEGGDAAEQAGAEEAEMEQDSEVEETTQAHDPPVRLNWDFTAQYEASQRRRRQAGEDAAAQERSRSSYWWLRGADSKEGPEEQTEQGEEDAGERDCRGGVIEECQAWQEAALVAEGKMVVPRLRGGCRATQDCADGGRGGSSGDSAQWWWRAVVALRGR